MKLIQVRQLFHDYVVFTKTIFFVLGLIFSYKLVEKTFLNILIAHLIKNAWREDQYDLRKAAVIVNLLDGTGAIFVALFAYVVDVHTGRFNMLVFATVVCIIGLLLNFLTARNENDEQVDLGLFYPALGIMTLAQGAQTVSLQAFLDDQFRKIDIDEDQRRRRTKFWWTLISFLAGIFSQFGPLSGLKFRNLAIVLASVTGGCFLVFLLGAKYYEFVDTIKNPFKDVGIVVIRAIGNRNVEYPQTDGDLQIVPRVPWLRWLDRAAITQGIEAAGSWNSAEQVSRVKRLFKMLPLCSCFPILGLVAASGSTFFFEEIEGNLTKILFLANLVRFTEFVVSETSSYVIGKLRERKQYSQQKMELVRIGIGMSCCVLCCLASWVCCRGQHDTISVYWLIPVYLLLGSMGGLSKDGFESFFESQVSKSLSSFGLPFREIVMGVGTFMNIVCILIFSKTPFRWLQKNLEGSRLDKYYILLAVLSFGNFMIYCLVGWWYGDDAFLVEDEEMGVIAQQSDEQHISHRSVSKPKESSYGDDVADSSEPGEEAETKTPEDSLLGSSDQSTRNRRLF